MIHLSDLTEAKPSADPLFLRIKDVARIFAVSEQTILNRVADGKFPAPIKWERTTLWHYPDLVSFAKDLADRLADRKP